MKHRPDSITLPFSSGQLFELVADIESYPRFVPGFSEARILTREENTLGVRQRIGLGPAAFEFHSVGHLDPHHHIGIRSRDGEPVDLRIDWHFTDTGSGCRLDFRADGHIRNPALNALLNRWIRLNSRRILQAFADEARRRYRSR